MKGIDLKALNDFKAFKKIDKIHAGWSNDLKFKLTDENNRNFLLRISDISLESKKREEFYYLKRLGDLNINAPKAIKIDVDKDIKFVYMILNWIEGDPLKNKITEMNEAFNYDLGYKSGQMLKKIHGISLKEKPTLTWSEKFNKKIDRKIKNYLECPIKINHDKRFIHIINQYRPLLNNRKQVIQHGDYHIGNMLIDKQMNLGVIDFNRMDIGDSWEEFNRITWCAESSPAFASGRINGYFNNQVPEKFFKLLMLYIANNQLASIPWALEYGDREVHTMLKQAENVYNSYEAFTTIYPKWYKKR